MKAFAGKDLAAALGVAPASLSLAVTKGHRCAGYDVSSWAVRSQSGRVVEYAVPDSAVALMFKDAPADAVGHQAEDALQPNLANLPRVQPNFHAEAMRPNESLCREPSSRSNVIVANSEIESAVEVDVPHTSPGAILNGLIQHPKETSVSLPVMAEEVDLSDDSGYSTALLALGALAAGIGIFCLIRHSLANQPSNPNATGPLPPAERRGTLHAPASTFGPLPPYFRR